ncbi:MAG: formylglycine-generating enzyme family protein [Verrucomicrobiae bacterium]|nr:formylglycine-generating enzyme family protein [Verrucomicrobiae bacterium]
MKYKLCFAAVHVLSAAVASADAPTAQPIARAGNGVAILSPISKATVDVRDGAGTVKVPAGMVFVPAGKFKFGVGAEAREVHLEAYCIGRFEVTNAEYKAFLDATHHRGAPRYWRNGCYPAGKANHPVLFVSLVDAGAYCAWVSKETGWNVVVPSAEQWEKAARGPKGWLYPWGNEKDSRYTGGKLKARFNYNAVCVAHFLEKEAKTMTAYTDRSSRSGQKVAVADITGGDGQRLGITPDGSVTGWIDHRTNTGFVNTEIYRRLVDEGGYTTPVGRFEDGKSAYGCYDMAGNAYEWTSTLITATNGAERGRKVNDVRGGSWYSTGRSCVSVCTGEGRSGRSGYHSVGFRIAMIPAPAAKPPAK